MDLISVAGTLAKPIIQPQIEEYLARFDPSKRLNNAFDEAKEQWLINLRYAVPKYFEYLNARIDDLDARLAKVYEDPQFQRVTNNLSYEAIRESLNERQRMLSHAAAGIVHPDLSIERKARVERSLRELDPENVLYLYGASRIPQRHAWGKDNSAAIMAEFLGGSSGDILASTGCVRMVPSGGGAGEPVRTEAHITQLGQDVLTVLRTYVTSSQLPFSVPGREVNPDDRDEATARELLSKIPHLAEFIQWSIRQKSNVSREYGPSGPSVNTCTLAFRMTECSDWESHLHEMEDALSEQELRISFDPLGFDTTHRVEITGPHDLLRHVADDCDATWHR